MSKNNKAESDFDTFKRWTIKNLDELISQYEEFSSEISPKSWRLSGSHISNLRKMKEEIDTLSPLTSDEKENEWVKKHRFELLDPFNFGKKPTHESNIIQKFESFSMDINEGDVILYQGSEHDVISKDDFIIMLRSHRTNKKFSINMSQANQGNIKIIR